MNGDKDTLRDEYPEDLIRSGVRGKYAKRYREGTNIVLIDPDLPKLFPDSETVWIRDGFHHEHKREVPDASLMISGLSAPADSGRKNSFFGWGRARKPVLFLLWI